MEHAFGQLKGRFPALKLLSGRGMEHIYFGVEALMILHNIFIIFDDPEDISGYDPIDSTPALEDELRFPFAEEVLVDDVARDRRAAQHEDMWHRAVEVLYHSFFLLDYCYIMTKTPAVTHIFYFCCTFRVSQ